MLLCLREHEIALVFTEVHQRACDSHIGDMDLAQKLIRESYYCPTLLKDSMVFVKKFDQCERHVDLYHTPGELLLFMISPWPFNQCGMEILDPFPLASRG